MITSNRRLTANRRNAKRSTGPRTPKGKRRSARNALRHGLLSRDVVITAGDGAENAADYDALLRDLSREFAPRTQLELSLIERIASGLWRLRRAQRHETGTVRESLDECRRRTPTPYDKELRQLDIKIVYLTADRQDSAEYLENLRTNPDPANPESLGKLRAAARERLLDLTSSQVEALDPCALLAALIAAAEKQLRSFDAELIRLGKDAESMRRYRDLHLERRLLVAAMPSDSHLASMLRYETMIDRQIHRAIAELRRRANSHPSRAPRRHVP